VITITIFGTLDLEIFVQTSKEGNKQLSLYVLGVSADKHHL